MNLTQTLHRSARGRPDTIATVFRDRRHTFAQVLERVARGALRALGLKTDDRVGMLSLNSDRYVEYLMAVPWAGLALNPVNIRPTA